MEETAVIDDIYECQGVSVEHADGSTECMDHTCELSHEFHSFHIGCGELYPPCPCIPQDHEFPEVEELLALAA